MGPRVRNPAVFLALILFCFWLSLLPLFVSILLLALIAILVATIVFKTMRLALLVGRIGRRFRGALSRRLIPDRSLLSCNRLIMSCNRLIMSFCCFRSLVQLALFGHNLFIITAGLCLLGDSNFPALFFLLVLFILSLFRGLR